MDFIDGLPRLANATSVLVIVDKFTRYAHFIPLSHPYTTGSVALAFMDTVYRLHGLPVAIILDHDPVFTSRLSALFKQMSSSYHLQSDGQTECVNQCLETFLRCFAHACPRK
jgi:hypothetical protein